MAGVKVGDEVRVFDRNGSRMGQPEGGWPGKIVKVGRKYVTVDYGRRSDAFEFNGKRANDPMGARRFKTLEQVAADDRHARAMTALKEHGVELRSGHKLTIEQIEALVDVARKFR